jgi:hypothetical protein
MEAYYKERQKQIKLYTKNIKKLAKNGVSEELSALKRDYVKYLLKPPPFKRDVYMTETLYIEELTRRIRETEQEFIQLKLDLCYDLNDGLKCDDFKTGLKEYDGYDKKLTMLKNTLSAFRSKITERVLLEEKKKKEQQIRMDRITEDFTDIDKNDMEGRKTQYEEIKNLSSEMANTRRQVVAYEIEHKELEYRLIQLYDPPPVKISR